MCPDENNNFVRIHRAHKKEAQCISDLLKSAMEKRHGLCSMVACLASDLGLDIVDFDMFYAKVWLVAKSRLKKELG